MRIVICFVGLELPLSIQVPFKGAGLPYYTFLTLSIWVVIRKEMETLKELEAKEAEIEERQAKIGRLPASPG